MDKIPIIDFGLIKDSERKTAEADQEWAIVSDKVFDALSRIGFMYIINHGIPKEKVDRAFVESEKFFLLPPSVKEKYLVDISETYSGYTSPGQEILIPSIHELHESFSLDYGKEPCRPEETPGLGPAMEDLRKECQVPLRKLLRLIALAFQLEDEEYFVKNFNGGSFQKYSSLNNSMIRANFYPSLPEELKIAENVVRLAEHTDYGTLLFQDLVGGLEVKGVGNEWIKATPMPGSVLVNTGDIMEVWTGGLFPATAHRILIPEEEAQQRMQRQSVAYFIYPDMETVVAPLDSPLCKKSGKYFQPFLFETYIQNRMKETYKY